jgi:hypothetical protein
VPPRAVYELHFLLHFFEKLREVFDLTDQAYFPLWNVHARSYIILLRQETLFLPGSTSWLRHAIASRHVRSVSAYEWAGEEKQAGGAREGEVESRGFVSRKASSGRSQSPMDVAKKEKTKKMGSASALWSKL